MEGKDTMYMKEETTCKRIIVELNNLQRLRKICDFNKINIVKIYYVVLHYKCYVTINRNNVCQYSHSGNFLL